MTILGALICGAIWAVTGMFSGAFVMLLLSVVMLITTERAYMPYGSSFAADLWYVTKWAGLVFGALGLLAGVVIGARIGRIGKPDQRDMRTVVKWSWNAFGMILGVFATFLGTHGESLGPLTNAEAFEQEMKATIRWAVFGLLSVILMSVVSIGFFPRLYLYAKGNQEVLGTVGHVWPNGVDIEYVTLEGDRKADFAGLAGQGTAGIKVGDTLRVRTHIDQGFKMIQVLRLGEQPDATHRVTSEVLILGILGAIFFGGLAACFFQRAIWRR